MPFLIYRIDPSEGNKFREQFNRNLRQIKSMSETVNSINTGTGVNAFTGLDVTTIQEEIELDTFEEIMIYLTSQCKKKGYAITVVEGCLLIGVYYTKKFPDNVFDFWVNSLKIETPIYDLRQSFLDPFAYPIFLHGFSTNDLIDIVSGRITIKMTIDLNTWLSSFEKDGYTYRWMTPKETARSNSIYKGGSKNFEINKRGIEIKKGDFTTILGGGLFVRMFTMFNTPSSIKKYIIETDKYVSESKISKVRSK